MTKDEFESAYAERSGVTVEWLHQHRRAGRPCDCGEEDCEGWQMAHLELVMELVGKGIKCYDCGLISYNQEDIKNVYCGHCHEWGRLTDG